MAVSKKTKLIITLADCVESLVCLAAVIDATGPVRRALSEHPEIWEHLSEEVKEALAEGYGMKEPNADKE